MILYVREGDGGREFTSNDFKNFLIVNGIKDKQIPKGYPREQGKVEAYNKVVIAEFLEVEELIDEKDGAEKYDSFVISYNYEREHGGINGMTPEEKFTKCLKHPIHSYLNVQVQLSFYICFLLYPFVITVQDRSVNCVRKLKCQPCVEAAQLEIKLHFLLS